MFYHEINGRDIENYHDFFCVKGNGKGEINENFYVWPIYKKENQCKMGRTKKLRFEMHQRDVNQVMKF